jgi:hypothetical protein
MLTALDAVPEDLHPDARAFVQTIRQSGWIATHIHASETSPSFTYTTGLWVTKGLPELIVFGLDMEQAHEAFTTIVAKAEAGGLLKAGTPIVGLAGEGRAALFSTDRCKHAEYMQLTAWFYDHPGFPCEQLVLADDQGALPWEPACDPAFRFLQPDLTVEGWTANLAPAKP